MAANTLPSFDFSTLQGPSQQIVTNDRSHIVHHVEGGSIVHLRGDFWEKSADMTIAPIPKPLPIYGGPSSCPQLVGRQVELEIMLNMIAHHRPVELWGPLGCGKTSLLRHLAYHPAINDLFPAGVIYLHHRAYQSTIDLVQEIYTAIYGDANFVKAIPSVLKEKLKSFNALIMVDDCHLASTELGELISDYPNFGFIFATREQQLWGKGESIQIKGLANDEAITLIAWQHMQELNTTEQQGALSLATTLQGHPLNIIQQIAAAQVQNLSLATIVEQLKSSGNSPWSWLKQDQYEVLQLLGVLDGNTIAKTHIQKITKLENLEAILESLQSLYLVEEIRDNYRCLDHWEVKPAARVAWQERLIEYFGVELHDEPQTTSRQPNETELLFQCCQWAMERQQWPYVIALGRSLELSLILMGQWQGWTQVLEWLLTAAQELKDETLGSYVLHQWGTRAFCLGDQRTAREYLEKARAIRMKLGDSTLGITQHNLDNFNLPPLKETAAFAGNGRSRREPWPWRKIMLTTGAACLVGGLGFTLWKNQDKIPSSLGLNNGETGMDLGPCSETVLPIADLTLGAQGLPPGNSLAVRPGELILGTLRLNGCQLPEEGYEIEAFLEDLEGRQPVQTFIVDAGQQQGGFSLKIPDNYSSSEAMIVFTHQGQELLVQPIQLGAQGNCKGEANPLRLLISNVARQGGIKGTVSLVCPSPDRDTIVELYSDDRSLLPAPLNLTIPANQDKASFTIPIPPNAYPTGFSPMIVAIVDGLPPASERINIPGLNQNSASSALPPSPNPMVNPSSGQTNTNSPNIPTIPQGLTPSSPPIKNPVTTPIVINPTPNTTNPSTVPQNLPNEPLPINQCPNASTTLALELPTQANWGGQNLTGKVTINCAAPPEGLTVQIIPNYSGVVLIPKTIKIQPGNKSSSFNFSIQPDNSSYPNGLTVEVSATWNAIDLIQRSITLPPL